MKPIVGMDFGFLDSDSSKGSNNQNRKSKYSITYISDLLINIPESF